MLTTLQSPLRKLPIPRGGQCGYRRCQNWYARMTEIKASNYQQLRHRKRTISLQVLTHVEIFNFFHWICRAVALEWDIITNRAHWLQGCLSAPYPSSQIASTDHIVLAAGSGARCCRQVLKQEKLVNGLDSPERPFWWFCTSVAVRAWLRSLSCKVTSIDINVIKLRPTVDVSYRLAPKYMYKCSDKLPLLILALRFGQWALTFTVTIL